MENGHQDTSEGNSESAEVDPYEKKYFALLKRCETTQQNNERLVNRLNHIKKMIRRLRHERRFLKRRLDKHEDDYRNVPLMLPVDSGMDEDLTTGLAAVEPDFLSTSKQNSPPARRSQSPSFSSTLLSQINSRSSPPTLAMWSSKAGSFSSDNAPKKKNGSEKDKGRGLGKGSSNPYFLFTQDQTSPINEGYEQPSKISYDMYNGEKDVWLYGGASEELNNALTLEKNSVILKGDQGPLS